MTPPAHTINPCRPETACYKALGRNKIHLITNCVILPSNERCKAPLF